MSEVDINQLKYPVGGFKYPQEVSSEQIEEWKDIIAGFPEALDQVVEDLTDEELNWIYRPGGWSIRQVIHHLADSHMNSFIRYKLALTEDNPTIKPYFEGLWADMPDGNNDDIHPSLDLIRGLHERWSILLENMSEEDFLRTFVHPESGRTIRLDQNLALYTWHCNHHLAHIRQALDSSGSFNE